MFSLFQWPQKQAGISLSPLLRETNFCIFKDSISHHNHRDSQLSRLNDDEEFLLPVAFDPNPNPLPRSVANSKAQAKSSNRVSTPPVLPPIGNLSINGDAGADSNSMNGYSVARFSWPNSPRLEDDEFKNASSSTAPSAKDHDRKEPIHRQDLPTQSCKGSRAAAPLTEGIEWYKAKFEEERERASNLAQDVAEFQRTLNDGENIQATNMELKEKRSTVQLLEAQREMAMRELKILSEHVSPEEGRATTRDSNTTNNLSKRVSGATPATDSPNVSTITGSVLHTFAKQLEELRDSFEPQIEARIKKRNELDGEIISLNRRLATTLQQFEQASTKNAELTALNSILAREVHSLYQNNNITPSDLALDMMRFDKKVSEMPSNSSDIIAGGASSTSRDGHSQGNDAEQGVSQDLRVVNIPKSQQRKHLWKKAGQKGKGFRGAFMRDGPAVVDTSVTGEPALQDQSSASVNLHDHRNGGNPAGAVRQGFAFFANQRKNVVKKEQLPSEKNIGECLALVFCSYD